MSKYVRIEDVSRVIADCTLENNLHVSLSDLLDGVQSLTTVDVDLKYKFMKELETVLNKITDPEFEFMEAFEDLRNFKHKWF